MHRVALLPDYPKQVACYISLSVHRFYDGIRICLRLVPKPFLLLILEKPFLVLQRNIFEEYIIFTQQSQHPVPAPPPKKKRGPKRRKEGR